MEEALSHFYLRWAVVILIGSLVVSSAGLMILSYKFTQLHKDVAALSVPGNRPTTEQSQAVVLSATETNSSALMTELNSIKDELARLRAEQRDINRILELPINPHEIVNMLSNYQTSTQSARKP